VRNHYKPHYQGMTSIDLTAVAEARRLASTGEAKRVRQAARLKLTEVAASLDKAPATLSRWENGVRVPNAEDAVRWLKLLTALQKAAI
jgi:DNA-binding transcriptional regulator YiaG